MRLNISLVLVIIRSSDICQLQRRQKKIQLQDRAAHSRMFNLPQVLLWNNSFNNEAVVLANTFKLWPSLATQALCVVRINFVSHQVQIMLYLYKCNQEDRNADFLAAAFPSSPYRCITVSSCLLALVNSSWAVTDHGCCLLTDEWMMLQHFDPLQTEASQPYL